MRISKPQPISLKIKPAETSSFLSCWFIHIFAQKGIPKMEQLSARLLLTAGILLLIAGVIFAILQVWLYTGLLWVGAFGCLMATLNFRDSKNDGG